MKKRIFIGSSLESKELAYTLQDALQEEFDCVLWYENFFSLGNHYYTDLIQKIITFDYAIMIGGEDDLVTRLSTKSKKTAPRDNIYLEYGLFSGILSPSKVLLLIHRNCVVASDLLGMSLSQYKNNEEATLIAKEWLKEQTSPSHPRILSRRDIGLMPTVGLAVAYYHNFIKPLLNELKTSNVEKKSKLTIFVPAFICNDPNSYNHELIMRKELINNEIGKNRKFRIMIDPQEKNILSMYDVPTTILALFMTANYVFGSVDGCNSDDLTRAKLRSLDDFYENLQILISNDYDAKRIIKLERLFEEDT